jgi:hypothetical protein
MNHSANTDEMHDTWLYLVRIWRGGPGTDAARLHGKVQHVVTGAAGYFDELSSLPEALERLMAEVDSGFAPDAERHEEGTASDSLQEET